MTIQALNLYRGNVELVGAGESSTRIGAMDSREAGTIAELFGVHVGLMLSIPGGLFELALGFWLPIKGFEPGAYARAVAK